MECALEHVVHHWGAADPELLAGGRQDACDPLFVPARTLLARKSDHEVEVLRVKLFEQTQKLKTNTLLLVEICNIVDELEIITDLGSFFLVDLTHNKTSNVGGRVHESNSACACCECKVCAISLNSERFAHRTFNHISCVVLRHGAIKETSGQAFRIPVCF